MRHDVDPIRQMGLAVDDDPGQQRAARRRMRKHSDATL